MVRRLALATIVALLTFSASGASPLAVAEPRIGFEQPEEEDGACSQTCVTCGCCALALEPVIVSATTLPEAPVVEIDPLVLRVPQSRARELLHVPRFRLA